MAKRNILFQGATILTMDERVPNLTTGDILVRGDHIEEIAPNIQVDEAEVIDAKGCIILPGFIDAHHHVWLGVQRRVMPDCADLFAYIDLVAEKIGSKYRPLDTYLSTKLTALASLDAGITTLLDAAHNTRGPEHSDASLDALRDSGIRALHMVGAPMDKQFTDGHLPGDLKRLAKRWNHAYGLVQVGYFGHLKFKLDEFEVARRLDMRVLFEMVGDYNKLPPEFAKPGLLGPHTIFNHCARLPQDTWKVFAEAGVNVTVNPRSDVLFGFDDERFAYQEAIDHGFKPGLGIDVETTYGSDMFGEMHALFHQQRAAMRYRVLRGEPNVPAPITVEAVLQAATVNGARVTGLEHAIGTLAPGKKADLIMVRTDSIAVFPVTNAVAAVVQAVERSDIDTVMVAGSFRKRGGKLVDVDVPKLRRDVEASRQWLAEVSGHHPDLFKTTA
ncbi:amidohydrolase [Bradyrhizobium sp. Leo121]|nr:amidohydrolase [Bradyrhizobium sp. Leo121]